MFSFEESSKIQKGKERDSTLRTSAGCYAKSIGLPEEPYGVAANQASWGGQAWLMQQPEGTKGPRENGGGRVHQYAEIVVWVWKVVGEKIVP